MEQFIEFVGNNWLLSGTWVALLAAFLLHRSKTSASAVSLQQSVFLINRKDAVVLDVRDRKEYDSGHIVESVNIPVSRLADRVGELKKHQSQTIVVTDKMGQHSGEATKILNQAGFTDVVRMKGGIAAWRADQLPLVQKTQEKSSSKGKKKKGKKADSDPKADNQQ